MIHKNFVVLGENCHWLLKLKCPAFFENVLWLDTTNIVSLQMNVGFNT
jgi:hypothetical protein